MDYIQKRYIKFKKPLPFCPSEEQVIFIENEYDHEINDYIQKNYDELCHIFNHQRQNFCYIPKYVEEEKHRIYKHYNPCYDGNSKTEHVVCNFSTMDFANQLFNGNVPQDIEPSLLVYLKYESTEDEAVFLCVKFVKRILQPRHKWWMFWKKDKTPDTFLHMATACKHALFDPKEYEEGVFYSEVNFYEDSYWDYLRKEDPESFSLITRGIHLLKNKGIDSLLLKKMLESIVDENRILSKIVITKDYRIILPDYGDMEIKMEPINKAVYLLFLKHKEGIYQKDLVDYKSELSSIYSQISNHASVSRVKSIDGLIDPTNNSLNEKIARIKQIFEVNMEEDLAEQYYIKGKRGEAKVISLPADLIVWE